MTISQRLTAPSSFGQFTDHLKSFFFFFFDSPLTKILKYQTSFATGVADFMSKENPPNGYFVFTQETEFFKNSTQIMRKCNWQTSAWKRPETFVSYCPIKKKKSPLKAFVCFDPLSRRLTYSTKITSSRSDVIDSAPAIGPAPVRSSLSFLSLIHI